MTKEEYITEKNNYDRRKKEILITLNNELRELELEYFNTVSKLSIGSEVQYSTSNSIWTIYGFKINDGTIYYHIKDKDTNNKIDYGVRECHLRSPMSLLKDKLKEGMKFPIKLFDKNNNLVYYEDSVSGIIKDNRPKENQFTIDGKLVSESTIKEALKNYFK